jgi:hypothetical protein
VKRRPLTDAPQRLGPEERQRVLAWTRENIPHFLPLDEHRREDTKRVGLEWEKCRDWHLKHDERARNWEAAFRMWLRNADKFEQRDRARGRGGRVNLDAPVRLDMILGGKAS